MNLAKLIDFGFVVEFSTIKRIQVSKNLHSAHSKLHGSHFLVLTAVFVQRKTPHALRLRSLDQLLQLLRKRRN